MCILLYSSEIIIASTFHSIAATEGIDAHVVHGYVVHENDSHTSVELSYPLDELKKIQSGRSFHHGQFIMGLRKEAIKAG